MSATLLPWSAVRGAAPPPPISVSGAIARFGHGRVVRVIYSPRSDDGRERFHCMYAPPPVAAVREILSRLARSPGHVSVGQAGLFEASILAGKPGEFPLPIAFIDGMSAPEIETALGALARSGWAPVLTFNEAQEEDL